jgi:dCTP deaminase
MDTAAERPYGHPELGSKYQNQQGAQTSKYNLNR